MKRKRKKKLERHPKDVVLLQLALLLMRGEELTYERLRDEFLLQRRSAERYLAHLRDAGLPVMSERESRKASYFLDPHRARLDLEAIDIPLHAARSLSLLFVASALLPRSLGIKEAVDRTVRASLRLSGLKAAGELRRLEDAVVVLENDAKDYQGKTELFQSLVDAVLDGSRVRVRYRSPKRAKAEDESFFCASIGLYKGGLYVLAVNPDAEPIWRALERIEGTPLVEGKAKLSMTDRQRALDEARSRWGPARPRQRAQLITLHFCEAAAPYVLARPWHAKAEVEPWPGGGLRMSLRLSGATDMFESWVKSWGAEVQVLRPADMALRISDEMLDASRRHRAASEDFAREIA
jgi:predicted DNA-binding transcriptional regulator YafY